MDAPEGPAAPASGTDDIPSFEELAADPEIAALLDFEPVPRAATRADGWSPELQRRFIAHLAWTGSPGKACDALTKRRSGIDKLAKSAKAKSFRDAWSKAVELAQRRKAEQIEAEQAEIAAWPMPFVDNRRKAPSPPEVGEGQVLNEFGEWEDKDSLHRRAEDARDSISNKLLAARRLYLKEISSSPGLRAAFELLTELPVDWDAAARLEPQPDEPWRKPSMRAPDMLLTAENGWMGDFAHGRDKKAELRRAIDAQRAAEGLEPVEWGED